jgi:hypothetical protein
MNQYTPYAYCILEQILRVAGNVSDKYCSIQWIILDDKVF